MGSQPDPKLKVSQNWRGGELTRDEALPAASYHREYINHRSVQTSSSS